MLVRAASPASVTPSLPAGVAERVTLLTAASGDQVASWDEEANHGLFTHHLLDALYGAGDGDGDGLVTAQEAKAHLDRHMTRAARKIYGRHQRADLREPGGVVLAAASADGAFPARPDLDGPVPVVGGAATRDGDDGADPARIVLPDGYSVADWALLAELRLERGEHTALLVEANRHIRAHGALAPLVDVREQAVAGLVAAIRLSTEAEALARWLQAAPQSHPERRDVLLALSQARRMIAESARFEELLGRPFSAAVREESVGWADLHYAALLDLPAVVTALIEGGIAADVRLKEENRPRFGDSLQRTLDALGHGEEFKGWHSDGETPLMIAALANARQAAEALVAVGANVNAKNSGDGGQPLHYAVRWNAREIAELLVSQGADIMATDKYGNTPLHEAASGNPRETAEWLVSQGADIMATNKRGETPLHEAASGNARETAEWLVSRGADIKATDKYGNTLLHDAAYGNARETAEWLVSRGADIMATNNGGSTPLHDAARGNARETAEWLVSQGADINAANNGGGTPLHQAALENARKMAEFLVSQGADIMATTGSGNTPLHYALFRNEHETAEWLVSRGADVKAKSNNGSTPLHFAALLNERETVELLVSRGADIMATNNEGETPLHDAALVNAREVAELLVSRGADVNAKTDSGMTPLDSAIGTDYGDEESRAATQALLRRLGGKTAEALQ